MTHTQQQREIFAKNKLQVMQILSWDEMQYALFQEEKGIEYLTYGLKQSAYWIHALTLREEFWKFWINQWNLIDQHVFLPAIHANKFQSDLLGYYSHIHNYASIECYPSKDIFEKAYAEMIGDIFDATKNEFGTLKNIL